MSTANLNNRKQSFTAAPKEYEMSTIVINKSDLDAFPLPEGDVSLSEDDVTFDSADDLANSDFSLSDLGKVIAKITESAYKKQSSVSAAAKRIFRVLNSDKSKEKAKPTKPTKPTKSAKRVSQSKDTKLSLIDGVVIPKGKMSEVCAAVEQCASHDAGEPTKAEVIDYLMATDFTQNTKAKAAVQDPKGFVLGYVTGAIREGYVKEA